jgi:ribosome-interacting GTPase 1
MNSQIRAADMVLWVVSLGDDDILTRVEEVREVLEEWHIGVVPVADGVGPVRERETILPAILVGTHADVEGADLREELLLEVLGDEWRVLRVSATTGAGLEELRMAIFDALSLVRVYTKTPGHKADMTSPFLLEKGSTVLDLAEAVHKEIAEGLSFARIWGRDAYDGQHVQRDHVLADGDVVELHA